MGLHSQPVSEVSRPCMGPQVGKADASYTPAADCSLLPSGACSTSFSGGGPWLFSCPEVTDSYRFGQ